MQLFCSDLLNTSQSNLGRLRSPEQITGSNFLTGIKDKSDADYALAGSPMHGCITLLSDASECCLCHSNDLDKLRFCLLVFDKGVVPQQLTQLLGDNQNHVLKAHPATHADYRSVVYSTRLSI